MLRRPFNSHTAHPSPPRDYAAPVHLTAAGRRTVGEDPLIRQTATKAKPRPASADRILAAALEMTDRGYDTFQIRAVAHRAHVSPGTVYRHFPSKDELLVACLYLWLAELVPIVRGEVVQLEDPVERIRHALSRITLEIAERPLMAAAFVRSYLLSNADSSGPDFMRATLSSLFAHAVGSHQGDTHDASELVTDIWSVNMPALLQGRITIADLQARLDRSVTAVGLGLSVRPRSSAQAHPA